MFDKNDFNELIERIDQDVSDKIADVDPRAGMRAIRRVNALEEKGEELLDIVRRCRSLAKKYGMMEATHQTKLEGGQK